MIEEKDRPADHEDKRAKPHSDKKPDPSPPDEKKVEEDLSEQSPRSAKTK